MKDASENPKISHALFIRSCRITICSHSPASLVLVIPAVIIETITEFPVQCWAPTNFLICFIVLSYYKEFYGKWTGR